jgi:hypothetical protein
MNACLKYRTERESSCFSLSPNFYLSLKRVIAHSHVAIKKNATPLLASAWRFSCHNGILQFASGSVRQNNMNRICWRRGGFAGNGSWRAEKLWRTFMFVTLVLPLPGLRELE